MKLRNRGRTPAAHPMSSLLLASLLAMSAPLPASAQEVHTFSITSKNSATAIRDFGMQARMQILASAEDLKGKNLNPVHGTVAMEQALNEMLAGTGLTHHYVGARTIALVGGGVRPGFLLAAAAPAPTAAQAAGTGAAPSSARGIEEVIVTAQKREESAQDIPIAIDVVSGDTFIREGIRDVKDIGKASTELEIDTSLGQGIRIGMRGMQPGSGSPTADVQTAVHVDGIFIDNFWALNGIMYDLERVEVLSGPQGTLYGRNSAAGAVNLITRRPGTEFGADGNVEFGSLNTRRYNAGVDVPLGDRFALRAAGTKFTRDSPFTDGGGAVDQWGGRLSANWRITDADTLLVTYDHAKIRGTNASALLYRVNEGVNTYNGTTNTFTAATPASVISARSLLNSPNYDPYDTAAYNSARGLVFAGGNEQTNWGVMANYTHDFGAFDLVLQAGHRELEGYARSATRGVTAASVATFPVLTDSDVAELRLVSDDQGSVTWVGGLFWYRGEAAHQNATPNALTTSGQPASNFFPQVTLANGRVVPTLGTFPDLNTGLDVASCPCSNGFFPINSATDAWAAYGQMTWTPESMQSWHFTAGLRYSYDDKTGLQGYFVNGTLLSLWVDGSVPAYLAPYVVAPNEAINNGPTSPTNVVATDLHLDAADTWDKVQWRLGVEYDVTDTSLLYATLSTGYRSGGFYPGVLPKVEPETLLALELGSKNRFLDNALQFNVASWIYDDRDTEGLIYPAFSPPFPVINNAPVTTTTSTANVRKVLLAGLSVDLDWAVTPNDLLGFSVTNVYSKVKDGRALQTGEQAMNEGERLGDAPKWQMIGRYSHTFDFANGGALTPGVKYQYQTKEYNGSAVPSGSVPVGVTTINPAQGTFIVDRKNSVQWTTVPAFGILDFQIIYASPGGNWDITAYVHNALDELDIKSLAYGANPTSGGATGNYGHVTATVGDPRTYGIILGARF